MTREQERNVHKMIFYVFYYGLYVFILGFIIAPHTDDDVEYDKFNDITVGYEMPCVGC